jgi:hypothetical protein
VRATCTECRDPAFLAVLRLIRSSYFVGTSTGKSEGLERHRCRDWLLRFMKGNQPKFLTKAELRNAAIRELNVSKNSFDFAWIDAIEEAGRQDCYEPLRQPTSGVDWHRPYRRGITIRTACWRPFWMCRFLSAGGTREHRGALDHGSDCRSHSGEDFRP